ncbi:MAG: MtrB/PioB family outer membrane beta-barrel protein [Deltaproteobacteria bacterium]|nr:MtrB/PioB family outer membrane beta-barrel protein [Deltaproteobacteria bacterium]
MSVRSARLWIAATLLAAASAAPAAAQPAPARGTRLEPAAIDPSSKVDPYGMSALLSKRRRSPSGWLYPWPLEPWRGTALGGGWLGSGSVAMGALLEGGETDEARYGRYADWHNGFWLRWLDAQLVAPRDGWLARIAAGEVGRDDASYRFELTRPGLVRLRGSWSRIPVVYADDAHVLFEGAGGSNLTLPAGLTPGATPPAALGPAFAQVGETELSVEHDERRIELELRPSEDWRLFARYGEDERDGAKPFGGSLGYPSTLASLVETVEPVDQITRRASTGVEWSGKGVQANARYELSLFRNRDGALAFDVPFAIDPNVARSRFALAPDNLWQQARGELALALPWSGRFVGTASWSRARQDDDLLPPTINGGSVGRGPFGSVDLDLWSQPGSRARSHADAGIDQLLLDGSLQLSPWRPLRLSARLRFLDHDDDTAYTAWNPLAGRIGYVAEDGGLEAQTSQRRVFEPGRRLVEDFRYASLPTTYRTRLARVAADWRALGRTRVDASLEQEAIQREHRERDETREARARLAVVSRDLAPLTLRLSGEFAKRTGSSYDSFFLADTFVSSLPGYLGSEAPYTLTDLRMHDLAARTRRRAELRVHWQAREDMDAAWTAGVRDDGYPSDFGLTSERALDASSEWGWQPSPRASLSAWYGFAWRERRQRSIADAAAPGSAGGAGSAMFPLANVWRLESSELSHAAGLTGTIQLHPRVALESAYTFLTTETRLDYEPASAGALVPGVTLAEAGDSFPTLRLREHVTSAQLRVTIAAHLEAGALYRFEHARIDDFHQSGLTPLSDPGSIFLADVDRSFAAHLFGAWLRVGF